MDDHERIWLQHPDDANTIGDGRLWCEDKIWPDDPEDGEPTEYVRADLFARLTAENATLRARLETVEAETRERLSNELDPEIGIPSDARLRNIHADLEMRGRKHPDFAVTVHHRNIVLSAVAAELRNLEPRHD